MNDAKILIIDDDRDVLESARMFLKQPGFTLVAVITLALGIGANATMFGVIDRLLLRPPAFMPDPSTAPSDRCRHTAPAFH